MKIRKATIDDIETLVRLRIDYLIADRGSLTPEEETAIRSQLATYFPKHINEGFIAILAEIDGQVISSAFLVITEKPANPAFITGRTGTVLNVLTYPAYRRKGIATHVMKRIIEEAKRFDVSSIELSATNDGRQLYKELGFVETQSNYTSMKLQLI